MQYVIGAKVLNRKGEKVEGLYTSGKYMLASIITWDQLHETSSCGYTLSIFDSMEECQKEISKLSDAYYDEFHSRARSLKRNPGEFGFFALRLNVPKFRNLKFEKVEAGKTYNLEGKVVNISKDFSGTNRYIITSVK